MKKHHWALVVAAVMATGCAQTPKRSADTLPKDSAILLIREVAVKQTSETRTGGVVGVILRPVLLVPVQSLRASVRIDEGDGFVFDTQGWCENRTPNRNPLQEVLSEVKSLCERREGRQQDSFCKRADNPDEVIFTAIVARKDVGFSGECDRILTRVIEPTASRQHPGYVAALRQAGFKTVSEEQAELAAERKRQQVQRRQLENRQAEERSRFAAELPFMRKRGTTVCRIDADGFTYRGFVEDSTDEKIMIRVADAFRTGAPNFKPGGFQPQIIWDLPSRWRLC